MAKHAKEIEALERAISDGQLTLHAEPQAADYRAPFIADDTNPSSNFYAVYGPAALLDQLQRLGCFASSARPRTDAATTSKAYLKQDIAELLLQRVTPQPSQTPPLFGLYSSAAALSSRPPLHAIGVMHSSRPAMKGEPEALSYLLLSADHRKALDIVRARLCDPQQPQSLQMAATGRSVGEFMVLPVRRSVADAVCAAHPEAIMLPPAPSLPEVDPASSTALFQLLQGVHDDPRFVVPVPKPVDIRPKERPAPSATVAAPIVPQPLSNILSEIAAHVTDIDLYEQIGGGVVTRLRLRMSPELQGLIRSLNDPRYTVESHTLSMPNPQGVYDQIERVTVRDPLYQALKPYLGGLVPNHYTQHINPEWLKSKQVSLAPASTAEDAPSKKKREKKNDAMAIRLRVRNVELVRNEAADGTVEDWLAITASHMARAERFALDAGISLKRTVPLTEPHEEPSILLLPVSASVAKGLGHSHTKEGKQTYPFTQEETPYASFAALTEHLRRHVRDKTLLSSMQDEVDQPPAKAVPKPKNIEKKANEHMVRGKALDVMKASGVQRLWMEYTKPLPTKHNKESGALMQRHGQTLCTLAIRINSTKARDFQTELKATGFLDLPGRDLQWIGKTGEGSSTQYIYQLRLRPADSQAWRQQRQQDRHWPAHPERRPIVLREEQVTKRLKRFMQQPVIREKPEQTAWRRLAALAEEGAIQAVQVRFSADDLRSIGRPFEQKLKALAGAAAASETFALVRDEWDEQGLPMHLHPVDDRIEDLFQKIRHQRDALRSTGQDITQIFRQREAYHQWLTAQPRNDDGSVTVRYLVIPNPVKSTLAHLQTIAPTNAEKARLFPQQPNIYPRILPDDKLLHLVPVDPLFFTRLAEHEGRVPSMREEPVMLSHLRTALKVAFGPQTQHDTPYDAEAVHDEMGRARMNKARQRLTDKYFPDARRMMLYGELRPENRLENLGKVSDDERIGRQHGLLMNITQRRDWTQTLKPMLEEMQRADFLDVHKQYLKPIVDEDPQLHELRLAALQEAVKAMDSLCHAANELVQYPRNVGVIRNFQMAQLDIMTGDAASAEAATLIRDALTRQAMQHNDGGAMRDPSLMAQAVLEARAQLRQQAMAQRETLESAREAYQHAFANMQKTGMMQQSKEPLFFLQGQEEGMTYAALDRYVTKHFLSHGAEPLRIMTYLPERSKQGDYSDRALIEQLRHSPPELDPNATPRRSLSVVPTEMEEGQGAKGGVWSERVRPNTRPVCPKNVTRDEFFEAGAPFFGPVASHAR